MDLAEKHRFLWLFFVAFSFGYWRFSLENESYIITIFFSLLASNFLLSFFNHKRNNLLITSGFFASIACLFHQIHFFWWLGLLGIVIFYIRTFKASLIFALPALLVPLVYLFVFINNAPYGNSVPEFFKYILHDYYYGNATARVGPLQHLLFIAVAIFRTFLQAYPYVINLLKSNPLFYIPLILATGLLIYLSVIFLKRQKILFRIEKSKRLTVFSSGHLFILVLQCLFAFFSNGNAEFMVMTAPLLAIGIGSKFLIEVKIFVLIIFTMFTWNLMYAIFPQNSYVIIDQKNKINFIRKQPPSILISYMNLAKNQNQYDRVHEERFLTDFEMNKEKLDSLLRSTKLVFTDMPDDYKSVNRGSFANKNLPDSIWHHYQLTEVFSTTTIYGKSSIYQVKEKDIK